MPKNSKSSGSSSTKNQEDWSHRGWKQHATPASKKEAKDEGEDYDDEEDTARDTFTTAEDDPHKYVEIAIRRETKDYIPDIGGLSSDQYEFLRIPKLPSPTYAWTKGQKNASWGPHHNRPGAHIQDWTTSTVFCQGKLQDALKMSALDTPTRVKQLVDSEDISCYWTAMYLGPRIQRATEGERKAAAYCLMLIRTVK